MHYQKFALRLAAAIALVLSVFSARPVSTSAQSQITVTLTSPANGSTFDFPAKITLSANVAAPDGSGVGVKFYAGSGLIGAALRPPFNFTWNDATPGVYAITAEAEDAFGVKAVSNSITVTIRSTCAPSWSIFPSPRLQSIYGNPLYGVAALSANEVWAVGAYSTFNVPNPGLLPLAAKWNGSQWTRTDVPRPAGGQPDSLRQIEAISSSDIWAFGLISLGAGFQPTAYHWNGAAWSAVAFPNLGDNYFHNVFINDLAATSSNNIWAVGSASDGSGFVPRIARWDGASWRQVSIDYPNVTGTLNGVVALAANDAWAVGSYKSGDGYDKLLILHWDGVRWRSPFGDQDSYLIGSPISHGVLNSISASAPNNIWAVGEVNTSGADSRLLAWHWDGARWNAFPMPLPAGRLLPKLTKVLTLAPDDAWALGSISAPYQSVVYHWDGRSWSEVFVPFQEGTIGNELRDLAAVSPGDIWAVGAVYNSAALVERFLSPCPNTAALSLLTLETGTVIGGTVIPATINLTEPAPAGGAVITLASNNSLAQVPGSVTIPAGARSVDFEIRTNPTGTDADLVITASMNGMAQRARLSLKPTLLKAITFDPPRVVGGSPTRATITLNGSAPAGGAAVELRSEDPQTLPVPESIVVPEGLASVQFTINTAPIGDGSSRTIRVSYNGSLLLGNLPMATQLMLDGIIPYVSGNYPYPSGGLPAEGPQGAVILSGPAPAGGAIVTLSGNSGAVSVPPSVIIPEGRVDALFNFSVASSVPGPGSAVITASWNGVSRSATLLTQSYQPSFVSLESDAALAGKPVKVTIAIDQPSNGPYNLSLFTDRPDVVHLPLTVIVPYGKNLVEFMASTLPVKSPTTVRILATSYANGFKGATLTVLPAIVPSISLDSATAAAGGSVRGTVSLSAPAPVGGAVVNLTNGNSSLASLSATVTIPQGATTGSFNIAVGNVAAQASVTIWASYFGLASRANLALVPTSLASFTLDPASVLGTQSAQATITLTGPLPSAPYNFTITNSNPSLVFAPQTVLMERGASSVSFNISTGAVSQPTNVTLSTGYNGTTKTVTLTVAPDTVTVTSLDYSTFRRQLRVEARSTSANASLGVYYTSNNRLIGYLANNGGGRYTATFSVVSNPQSITVKSNFGGSAVGSLTGAPPPPPPPPPVTLSAFTIEPGSVNNGVSAQGTITLSDLAPTAGATVALASNNAAAVVEDSIVIPAGSNSATFTVTTRIVTESTVITISASYGGVTRTATLTILPIVQAGDAVTIQTASYNFFRKQLTVQATSTNSTARLQVFVTSSGQLLGTLTNNGGGRFSGQLFSPSTPQNITVRSSLGGSATRIVR